MTTRDELFPGTDATSTAHREFDWSTTSLGPVENWPDALVTAIRTLFPSEVGQLVWWGEDLVQLFNHAYTPMAGDLFPEAVGQRAADCWRVGWEQLGPLAHDALRGTAVHRTRQRVLLDRFGYLEETFFTFSYSPILGSGDTVNGVFVATTDVTQQVLAERRMSVLHELGSISVASRDIDDVCRASLDLLAGNEADVPFASIHLRTTHDAELGEIRPVASTSATLPGRPHTATTVDRGVIDRVSTSGVGEIVGATAVVLPLHASSGRPVGVLVAGISALRRFDEPYRVFLDLVAGRISTALTDAYSYAAERRRARDLEELDAAKTRFFENVSHEFRTPLTLLLGPLGDVVDDQENPLPPHRVRSLQTARRAALRLQRLVDTLLDVARGDADGFVVSLEPTDIVSLTTDCASMFRDATARAGVELHLALDGVTHRFAEMDRTMWTHVVMNLVSNAVKFTTAGSVTVSLRDDADTVTLTVTDTGPGVPEADRAKIFDRFYQVAAAAGRSREGSGVGLSLVRDLVAALHGTIDVSDGPDGTGSTFTVTLPRTVASAPPASDATTQEVAEALGAGYIGEADTWRPLDGVRTDPTPDQRQVVLVEDNADMRDYLVGLLREQNWHVTMFADVDSAMAHARAHPPDVILSDIMLPGRSGLSLVDEARSDGRLVRVPIVLLSARAGSESVVEGLRLGADDYVTKPFQPAELVARVRVHLELARLREQLLGSAQREVSSLRTALDSRSVLSQAVGLLMVTQRMSPEAAFDHIATMSQAANVKARVIAEQLVRDFVEELGSDPVG
ncbi:response regulator [Rhodococcus sp. BP-149]|uniref:ATP-binding protein n=1 Tax=unclassified Rhodococcus (in: high G+C Gram-positive bacteria) TaxID=192944 RepID=UPI001C9AFB70|nr:MULTISPECIES: ATP-binding protein [unclassified Rhodococcus (in: high G+C Gram-positive bacteria)]MBY6684439.1 response regulator [Rhodococcus sp. BP-288]MBY6692900.1 response regulator [Rhodococcus sp. BP-188]MBY6697097.1 response regulator [Rhodococcus sp. BP-285]MBY6701774.1 response regulator [Rhodococcus sp. BP-283]MBY6710293.1 response regulator [Rhodococcus sp. BP-160]